jgi:hypothetical protein
MFLEFRRVLRRLARSVSEHGRRPEAFGQPAKHECSDEAVWLDRFLFDRDARATTPPASGRQSRE